ncbi:hypothetical protein F0344_22715 [Streptomyces finlayi]|uniref:Uncharacterized protein n=1 Tax=Streptomyces finlayi TaxID=67296 RepID=A0A7G7BNY5_9ACTN|nr:hypothetical protein [Streptomyces finlayi]QNE77050.1 hypothetical protein F0344_22715 [Streptomyces finlayi]
MPRTSFEDMSHERMLRWLDQTNSGAVQGAADRLLSASTEIKKIAEDLKIRPQIVEWKGEGANAFRTWTADLANATLRLAEYSEGASKRLAEASDAIALAQMAIPRTHAGAQANLDAALAARNDPDASAVARTSAETLIAGKEANRQEAAQVMKRLSEAYELSSDRITGMDVPKFPPPPEAFVPNADQYDSTGGGDYSRTGGAIGGTAGGVAGGPAAYAREAESAGGGVAVTPGLVQSPSSSGTMPRSVDMEIDSVATLPDAPAIPSATPPSMPGGGKADGGLPSVIGGAPPIVARGPGQPPTAVGGGKSTGTSRLPVSPATGRTSGPGPIGRPSGQSGIVGGRPVPQSSGRPMVGLPRGTVIGGEGTHGGRAPMGHGPGMGGPTGGQNGMMGGRRLAGETGGIVGGRPQQQGATSGRPFTPGGSGLVRGGGSPQSARGAGPVGRGGALNPQRPGDSRREARGERPDYLTEDEETWQQNGRRIVPPVVD